MSEELSEREEATENLVSEEELTEGETGGQAQEIDLSSPEGRYLAR